MSDSSRPRFQEVIDFMKTRRSASAKNLAAPGPNAEELQLILAIASRVPDHGKLAPWRFIAYSRETRERLGEAFVARALELNGAMNAEAIAAERTRLSRSPVVIGLVSRAAKHPKIPQWEQLMSAGAVGMNLLIAANALGYDAQWITEWIAYDEKMAPLLGLAPGEKLSGFIHIGASTLPKTERDRPDLKTLFSLL